MDSDAQPRPTRTRRTPAFLTAVFLSSFLLFQLEPMAAKSILPMFGVVVALAVFIYVFAVALERSRSGLIPVVFDDPAAATASVGERRELAGRVLVWRGEAWVEEGVSPEAVSRRLDLDSAAGRRVVADRPELRELAELEAPAVIELAGEVVEIR